MNDAFTIPPFLLRGHPDHEKAVAEGREAVRSQHPPPPAARPLAPPKRRGGRKRRSAEELTTLRGLGFNSDEIRDLSIPETERICHRGIPAGTWRTERRLQELKEVGE